MRIQEIILKKVSLVGASSRPKILLTGGVGNTYIKCRFNSADSRHGDERDPVNIIVWGQ